MQLVERSEPLEALGRLAAEAASGRGRLALVEGEAGLGKTTLVRSFCQARPADLGVLWGACDPSSLPTPLGPLVDVATGLDAGFRRLLEREAPPARIFAALGDILAASPCVLVLEDVHWADEATLDLLAYLGRSLEGLRSLVVVTYRDDEISPQHPFRIVRDGLVAWGAQRLRLKPLSPEGVGRLAYGTGRDPGALHVRTGGNPFFVTEVLATDGDTLPPTLRDAILARAARLSDPGRRALEAAAVLGPRFPASQLAEMGIEATSFEESLRVGVLVQDAGLVAFRHELSRDAILRMLAPARAAELNARALGVRRHLASDPEALAMLAAHAEAAGDGPAVLEFAPRAARRSAALRAHREAAAQYARALRWAAPLPPAERAALEEALSYEGYLTSAFEEALAARRRAFEIWRSLGDGTKIGESHRWLSRLAWFLGRNEDAEREAQLSLAALEGIGPGPQLAWAYANLAQLHVLAGRVQEAKDWGQRAIDLAESLGESEILCHALNSVGLARYHETDDSGAVILERSLALALELQYEDHVSRGYTNLATRTLALLRFEAARRYLDDGLRYASEHDLESYRLYLLGWLALCEFWEGRFDQAAALAEQVLRDPRLSGPGRVQPLVVLARLRTRRGEPGASELLDEAHALAAETDELQRVGPVAVARAEAAWLAGDLERVREIARPAFERARDRNHLAVGELASWLWRAGDLHEAPARAALPYRLQVQGDARAAADAWRAVGAPYERAMALADLDDEAALREAHDTFERLGATPMADRLRQRLRSHGVRKMKARPASQGRPSGLTAREVDVLRLVAEGLRNAEIAERLFVSTRTVDHHVSALLGKLNARSRAELAGRAAEILG